MEGGGGGGGQQASSLGAKQAVEFPQVLASIFYYECMDSDEVQQLGLLV